jgi:hypothetical protein
MYDFAIVALLALATLKLVDFLTDAVPQLRSVRTLATFVIAVGATVLIDYSVFQGFGIEIRNATVGTWVTGFIVAGVTVPWRALFAYLTHDRARVDETLGEQTPSVAPRKPAPTHGRLVPERTRACLRPNGLAFLDLLELFDRHQHGRASNPPTAPRHPPLEQVHETAAREAHPQLALQHRRRAEPARHDQLHRLVEQFVALVVVRVTCGAVGALDPST